MILDFLEIGLAAWAFAWALSLWHKMDWLRERLGIYFVERDGYVDRDDAGGLGGWLNCPSCSAVVGVALASLLWAFFRPGLVPVAGLGLALLLARWYESLRPKAEWWR